MKTNPVDFEVFKNLFLSIAEEMGAALKRTAFSPNIKERRDYSCAVFDGRGQVVAMGDHMPVHLGSMPMSVRAAVDKLELKNGDVAILNDPFCGGTHLPDITLVMPVFLRGKKAGHPAFYVASRAHHADDAACAQGIGIDSRRRGQGLDPPAFPERDEVVRRLLGIDLRDLEAGAVFAGAWNP